MTLLKELINETLLETNLAISINSDIIIVAEMVLILLSLFIASIFVFMLKSSGLLHFHLMLLIYFAYLFFFLSLLSRLVITIGILFNMENSGIVDSR
jgi:hypothetical protein